MHINAYQLSIYLETFDDPCFDWKRPCYIVLEGPRLKNRGQTGSRYVYIYIYIQHYTTICVRSWDISIFLISTGERK